MKNYYECEFLIDKKMYLKIFKITYFSKKNKQLIGLIFLSLFFILISFIISSYLLLFMFIFYLLYILVFRYIVIVNKRYKRLIKLYQKDFLFEKVIFNKDNFCEKIGNSNVEYSYNWITCIKEYNNYAILYLKNDLIIILFYDKFTVGNWNDCKEFILKRKDS